MELVTNTLTYQHLVFLPLPPDLPVFQFGVGTGAPSVYGFTAEKRTGK